MAESSVSARELFVLGVVSREPIHGHGINRIIEISEADRWVELSQKHVYYVLRKLRRSGLITAREERPGGAPPRVMYTITAEGRATLREWLQSSELSNQFSVSPFDTVFAMLAFAEALDDMETVDVLRARRAAIAAVVDDHSADAEQVVRDIYGVTATHMFLKTRALLGAELAWIDAVLREVEAHGWSRFRLPEIIEELDDDGRTP